MGTQIMEKIAFRNSIPYFPWIFLHIIFDFSLINFRVLHVGDFFRLIVSHRYVWYCVVMFYGSVYVLGNTVLKKKRKSK